MLGLFVDLVDVDVGKPERPLGAAFDDPAAETAAQFEREVGAASRLDQFRPPTEQPGVERARGLVIAGVQLQVHNWPRHHLRLGPQLVWGTWTADQVTPPTSRAGTAPSISLAACGAE